MKTQRTVNFRAVLVLAVTTIVLAVGVHFLHAYQVKRNANELLTQVDQAEQEGHGAQALAFLNQYLGLAPNNNLVLARYALLADKLAKNRHERTRAYELLEKVLRNDGARQDIRRSAVRLAIDLGRYSDARHHLDVLRKDAADDVELLQLQGRCEAGEHRYDKAAEFYARAVEQEPFRVDLVLEYAQLLRGKLSAPAAADEVMAGMVKAAPYSVAAHLAAARYYLAASFRERDKDYAVKAETAVKKALDELGAHEANAFLLAAEIEGVRRNFKQAEVYLQQGLKQYPDDSHFRQALAELDLRAGRPNDAWDKLKPTTQTLPARPEELWSLGNLLIDLNRPDEVEPVIERLMKGQQKWGADALRGRLRMRQKAWGEALALLEAARAGHPPMAVSGQVELLLAACYERLGNPDQRLQAARQAQADNPGPAARLAVAAALAALGKTDEAIHEYLALPDPTPEVRGELVRLLLVRNLKVAPACARWEAIDAQLKQLPTDTPAQLLRAEILVVRNKTNEARALVDEERKRDPKQVAPWLFLLALAAREDKGQVVLPLLDEAERATGPRPEWTLVRASHALRIDHAGAAEKLKKLEADLDVFQGTERDQLLRGLGRAFLLAGDPKSAARLWRVLAQNQPGDIVVRFQLMALTYGAPAAEMEQAAKEMDQLVDEVRRLEGGDGILTHYGEAARLLLRMRANGRDKAALVTARRHLQEAEELRPSWSAIPSLEADAFELEGRTDKALEKYQAALDRGEDRLGVVRRVLELLAGQGRFAEAQALLNQLPQRTRSLGGLDRVGVELTLLNPDAGGDAVDVKQHALEMARKSLPADSKNYRDHLWLGQMCLLAGDKVAAEKAFRQARALADTTPATWVVLILFLLQNDRKAAAETELAAAKEKLPADALPQVLGPGYEGLGQTDKAEKEYLQMAAARAGDPSVQRNLASFYLRTRQPVKAEPVLRKLSESRGKSAEAVAAWSRRTLAIVLARGGNYKQFQEAEALVKEQPDETLEDRKTRALVRATRPEHRREAIEDFERLSSGRETVAPDVKFLLAGLYEADGKWDLALRQLRSLVENDKKNLYYHTYYVQALLRHKEVDEAEMAVERFAKVDGSPLQKLALRVQVLRARGKTEEGIKLVQAYAQEKDARLAGAAQLLDILGATAEAEKLYRAYVSGSKEPQSVLLLVAFLGRHDRLAEALDHCEAAWGTCPPDVVARVSVGLLRNPTATDEQYRRVEQHLTAAMSKQPKAIFFPQLMAELLDNRSRHDEAAELYRKVLTQEPRNAIASNNLANILALQGITGDEPLKLIQTALDEAGPNADMLDTRAVVYLQRNRPDLAIRDLQQALTLAAQPAMYFHLAQAQQQAKDPAKTKEAFDKAKELGLRSTDLHPLERKAWEKMKKEFE